MGYLEDDCGDDRYQGGVLVQGATTNGGLGMLIDPQGADQHNYAEKGHAYAEGETGTGIVIENICDRNTAVKIEIKQE